MNPAIYNQSGSLVLLTRAPQQKCAGTGSGYGYGSDRSCVRVRALERLIRITYELGAEPVS